MLQGRERGYILPYVLMIIMILAIFIPGLLHLTSTRALTDKNSEYHKKANYLARSVVDHFNGYINGYQTNGGTLTPRQFFDAYPGWGTRTITLPEGNAVTYSLCSDIAESSWPDSCGPYPSKDPGKTTIKISANADPSDTLRNRVEMSYHIDSPPSTGGVGGGTVPGTVNGQVNPLLIVPQKYLDQIEEGISQKDLTNNGVITPAEAPDFRNDFEQLIPTRSESIIVHNSEELQEAIQAAPENSTTTITCECGPDITLTHEWDYRNVYPYSTKTFVIYFPQGGFTVDKWSMKGMLIAEGDIDTEKSGNYSLEADNVITFGSYNPGPSDKNFIVTGIMAVYDYQPNSGGSDYPQITFQETAYAYPCPATSGWSPNPVRTY